MPDVFVSSNKPTEKPGIDNLSKEKIFDNDPINKRSRHGRHHFSSYNFRPEHIDFETKDSDEEIILMLRQHPIINLKWIVITAILLVCLSLVEKTNVFSLLPSGYPLIIKMAWYLATYIYAVEGFFHWYFNVYFITKRRVIDVDFFNIISKRVTDAEIDKIQDVTYTNSGAIGTVFNYGEISIQTSGEAREIAFENVPHPDKVADILDDLRAMYK